MGRAALRSRAHGWDNLHSAGALAPLRRDRRRSDRRGWRSRCDDSSAQRCCGRPIGGKSWPFDIRLRLWVFRPHIGLLTLRSLAGAEVRSFATNGLESGRFHRVLLDQKNSSGCLKARSRPTAFGSCTTAAYRKRPEIVKTIPSRRGYTAQCRSRHARDRRRK